MFENYVYPPRPEKKFPASDLQTYDNMKRFIGQPKLNGSCCVAIVNGEKTNFYNRHKETFAKFIFSGRELRNQFSAEGLTIFVGEYLNKSQNDETNNDTNGRLVLFDVIWYDGKSLVGSKFIDRQNLLREKIFKVQPYGQWVDKISDNLFIVKNFDTDFKKHWDDMIKYEVYEGLVLKKADGILQPSRSEKNNMDWQIKCRKPTKNYTY